MKQKAVIVCPGRGTYNKAELGYLARHHASKEQMLDLFEAERVAAGQTPVRELDRAARFAPDLHTRGDNASALIYAASYCDAMDVFDTFDVVAVTGNSMGWYTSLAVAGAVSPINGFKIVNTMGRLMQDSLIGGQLVYPVAAEDWRPDAAMRSNVINYAAEIDARDGCQLFLSIDLGGMLVLAGNAEGLAAFEALVPKLQNRFPLRLGNHSAFHTPLQKPVAKQGRAILGDDLFGYCRTPMIDGRGAIWWPGSYASSDLRRYTLGHQVTEPYDFSAAIRVAARTFAPDVFVVLGPGDTMGGAVAQSLIAIDWQGFDSKAAFQNRQAEQKILVSIGRDSDRAELAVAPTLRAASR